MSGRDLFLKSNDCFAFKPQNIIHINRWLYTHTHERGERGDQKKLKKSQKTIFLTFSPHSQKKKKP